jgi:Tol biopolymer transport system component
MLELLTKYHAIQNEISMKTIFIKFIILMVISVSLLLLPSCGSSISSPDTKQIPKTVPHVNRWGIYALDIVGKKVELLYSSETKIAYLNLNKRGDRFAFSQLFGGNSNENEEICIFDLIDGKLQRLTNNDLWDIYPVWSADGTKIAFLTLRDQNLDIFVMGKDGSNQQKLFDSGYHDADIDWAGDRIVFTARSRIWIMRDDGTDAIQVTEPPDAGVWGNANLPFGDYDPRLSPDGSKIAFERLEDDVSPHGNYNIYVIDADGSDEARLTDSGYSQGIVSWSHSADKMVFVVAAVGDEGKYDIYIVNSDGSNIINITPDYFPGDFLCYTPVFSKDDSKIYFIGEWWE